MKLFQIASEANIGSIGIIAEHIGQIVLSRGGESYIAYGRSHRESKSKLIKIGSFPGVIIHGLMTRLFDVHGLGSTRATKELIRAIERIEPDILHLHHLHGYYINIKILFDFISKSNIPIVWTFHDCWSFTGHCCYFDRIDCNKWISGCYACPQKKNYPASYFLDRSKKNYDLKKNLFTSVRNLTIVTPSKWLEKLVKNSFFQGYPVFTIHNGVDLTLFKPIQDRENIRKIFGVENKFVILGVAKPFNKRKGFPDFLRLSERLKEDEIIILVGLDEKQIKKLPSNIIGIKKTDNRKKLAELYSASDLFMNPTWEDNFPTTNLEALACGTPVATYNTGGSIEAVDQDTGFIIEKGSISGLIEAIKLVKNKGKEFYSGACRRRAEKYFDKEKQLLKYLDVYKSVLKGGFSDG